MESENYTKQCYGIIVTAVLERVARVASARYHVSWAL